MPRISYQVAFLERLDQAMKRAAPEQSRNALQKLIRAGDVVVNGKVVTEPASQVAPGDSIDWLQEPARATPAPAIGLDFVYEDNDVIVIDKPPGLVAHATPSRQSGTLAGALLAQRPELAGVGDMLRPGIVHRLDADTSGLMIVAKTSGAYEYLKRTFHDRRVKKNYLALVHGSVADRHGVIDTPIGRRAGSRRLSAGFGRPARTEYTVIDRYRDLRETGNAASKPPVDTYTFLSVQLHTGRTHQIRVHCASLGHPVAGDPLYGGEFRQREHGLFPRQFLHASELSLALPSGIAKTFTSRLPADLEITLKALTKIR